MSSLYVKGLILLVFFGFFAYLLVVGLAKLAYEIWDAIYRAFFVSYAEWHTYEARVTKREKTEASDTNVPITYVPMGVGRNIVIIRPDNPEEYTVWVELMARGADQQPADAANLLFGRSHALYGKDLYEAVEEGDVIGVLARVGYSKNSGKAKRVDVELP